MGLKVLMLGWELPPYNSGGLGEACLGLSKALAKDGADITFVLPQKVDLHFDFMKLEFANIKQSLEKLLRSYDTNQAWKVRFKDMEFTPYDFVRGALVYADRIGDIVERSKADIVHAHDWLTFPAGMVAKEMTGKPFVAHIHATEFDRTGGHYPNPAVYTIEKEGLSMADRVISVSQYTKDILVAKYGISSDKISVVHNGVETMEVRKLPPALSAMKGFGYKVVLYLGRITLQKGPEYFVRAARGVLSYDEKVVFVVTGSGDMQDQMISEAAQLGILEKFVFTGFLRGEEKNRIYQSADLYVMPSVSEPFGITPLEAIANGTPVLVSKQSGVSEVLNHALKVDFWDVEEMTNKILAVMKYPPLCRDLKWESGKELKNISWDNSARECINIYNTLI